MRGSLLAVVLLAQMAALALAFPAKDRSDDEDDGPLPFLQFTKGGIRVNFGGYHAQAGLGGLLTGRAADGGLHASAGIPSGAHASAGLGGSLTNGPEGGLHARAGLGNGGPEAEAGLSGSLAGPKPTGDIYSRAQIANGIEVQKTKGKNIQVISRSKKASELDASISGKKESASASATADASTRNEAADEPARDAIGTDKPSTPGVNVRVKAEAGAGVGGGSSGGVYGGFNGESGANANGGFRLKYNKGSTFFDDIFNIPISALTAVNKLLKNHVGKK